MRYYLILTVGLLFLNNLLMAKDMAFSFDIPDSLKKNANAVYLFKNIEYNRTSKSNLTIKMHYAVTLLSERADEYAHIMLSYDKFTKVSNIECNIYNAVGEKVAKIKDSDIRDYSAFDGFSLYSDNRLKEFKALNNTYPYTIELSYETNYNGFVSLPNWLPQQEYNESVIESNFKLCYPEDLPINFKEKKCTSIQRSESAIKSNRSIEWKALGLKALEYEKLSPAFSDLVASVAFSPNKFYFDKSEGEFVDWKSLGKWNYGLLENKFELSEKTKNELETLKKKHTSTSELIKAVYKYMQSRTRYVSIQLGIGGFKPFSPEIVDQVGYGDCKALSFFTKSMLDYVGVHSYYTIIGVNKNRIEFSDFANINQMNHAILCVPNSNDTIWLECTSQSAPFNHLFDGSLGRKALLVGPDGGSLVTTPNKKESKQNNVALLSIDLSGDMTCNISTSYTGTFYDDNFGKLHMSDKELREIQLKESVLSDLSLISIKRKHEESIPKIVIEKNLLAKNFVKKSGNRTFVELSPFLNLSRVVPQKSSRQNPIFVEDSKIYEDEILLNIPDGFTLEYCPNGTNVESKYGVYNSNITVTNNQISFKRIFEIKKNTYSKEEYLPFIEFINSAASADNCKVVFKML